MGIRAWAKRGRHRSCSALTAAVLAVAAVAVPVPSASARPSPGPDRRAPSRTEPATATERDPGRVPAPTGAARRARPSDATAPRGRAASAARTGTAARRAARAELPFGKRYAESYRGGIVRAANTVVTCYPPDVRNCPTMRGGDGINNNPSTYVDSDGQSNDTFNSSTAKLTLPASATVKLARLYWGGRSQTRADTPSLPYGNSYAPDYGEKGNVQIKTPGGSGYTTVTAAAADIGETGNDYAGKTYGASADVTALVQSAGSGDYTVADVQTALGYDGLGAFGGWSLVVIFADPQSPLRNLSLFDGFLYQASGEPSTDATISGFQTPIRGAVSAQLGEIVYDGDRTITGDSLTMKTTNGPQTVLSDAVHSRNDFFNSSIATLGANETARSPAYVNQLGYDSSTLDVSSAFRNGDTDAKFSFATAGDTYWPHALFVQVNLNQPKIELTKTAKVVGGGPAQPGATVEYTVNAVSKGPDEAVETVLTDPIPAGTTYVPGSLKVASGANAGDKTDAAGDDQGEYGSGNVTFRLGNGADATTGGTLDVGDTTSVTFRVKLGDDTGGKTITNTATVEYGGADFPSERTSTDADADLPVSKVTFAKTASPANPNPGDKVTYTVKVTNPTTVDFKGATFTDDLTKVLDDATYNDDAKATSGTTSYTEPKLTWTGDVPAGQTVTVTYSVTVGDPPAGDLEMTNVITSTTPGTNCPDPAPPSGGDPDCSTDQKLPKLKVKKTASPNDPKPGDKVSYTVTVENTGKAPYKGATFTDDLTKVLDDADYNDDASADIGSVSYSEPKLTWTGDLDVGDEATVTYSVTVKDPPTGDFKLDNAVVSPGSNCKDGTDPECSTDVPVPNLKVNKSASPTDPKPGDTVTYTVTVENTGKAPYPGATFTDDLTGVLDDATYNDDANASSGTTSYAEPKLTWTGDVDPGQKVTVTYSVTVKDPPTGDHSLKNAVVADGSNCITGKEPECSPVVPVPALEVEKKASPSPANPGQKVTYTVTVKNVGEADYEDASLTDDLTKVLDDADYNDDAQASSGTVSYAEPKLTWKGTVPKGATVTITYSVTVKDPPAGDHEMANTVVVPGSNCETGTEPECSPVVPVPALEVKKSSSPTEAGPGDKVTYTVTIKNVGEADYKNATLTDDLTKVLDDADYNDDAKATSGMVSYTKPNLSWKGTVPKGATVTITYSVTVKDPPAGDHKMDNTVVVPGSNCKEGTDPECSTVVPVKALKVVKTVSPKEVKPGDKVTYKVTVENVGDVAYPGASFTDDLTKVLDDADYNDDASADIGSTSYTQPKLKWTGDLDPGQKATVTYSVTVKDPPAGDSSLVNSVTAPDSNCKKGTEPECSTEVLVAKLKVVKVRADRDGVVKPGSTVTYRIVVTNVGRAPYKNAEVVDDLTDVLDDATYNDDASASSGKVSYAEPKLTWTGDLDPGKRTVITYSVTVKDPANGDNILRNAVVSPGSNCVTGKEPECHTIEREPDLVYTKKASPTRPEPGDTVTYTITVENTGTADYTDAEFTDDLTKVLDDAEYNDDAKASSGDVSYTEPVLTWHGDVPVRGKITITYSVKLDVPGTGDGTMTNTVISNQPGNNCEPGSKDPDCTAVVPVPRFDFGDAPDSYETRLGSGGPYHWIVPGLTLGTKITAEKDARTPLNALSDPGDDGVSSFAPLTQGQKSYAVDVRLRDTTGRSATVAGWIDFDRDGTFDTGERARTTVAAGATKARLKWPKATVPEPGRTYARFRLYGVPASGERRAAPSPAGYGGAGEVEDYPLTIKPAPPRLVVVKKADRKKVKPGGVVHYTVKVTNPGPTAFTADRPAVVEDDLSDVLDDARYNRDASATSGKVSYRRPVLTWKGPLAAGATVTITYSVTVRDPIKGDLSLRNAVTGKYSNCTPGGGDARCRTKVRVRIHEKGTVRRTG